MSHTVSSRSAAETVEALIQALATIDAEAMQQLIDPDVRVIEPAGLPYGGIYEGADAFFNELLPVLAGPFELVVSNSKVFDGGDAAAANMIVAYTSRRTGETIRMPYVEVYDVSDGLITKIDVYPQDVTALAEWMDANR